MMPKGEAPDHDTSASTSQSPVARAMYWLMQANVSAAILNSSSGSVHFEHHSASRSAGRPGQNNRVTAATVAEKKGNLVYTNGWL